MKIIDKNVETYQLIKKALDVSSLRSRIIANNLANVNTPGYKRLYVSFEDALNNVEQNKEIKVKRDYSSSVREDGNNVDIDNEIVNNTANTLMYNALINQVNTRIQMRTLVIKGGR